MHARRDVLASLIRLADCPFFATGNWKRSFLSNLVCRKPICRNSRYAEFENHFTEITCFDRPNFISPKSYSLISDGIDSLQSTPPWPHSFRARLLVWQHCGRETTIRWTTVISDFVDAIRNFRRRSGSVWTGRWSRNTARSILACMRHVKNCAQ